MLAFNFDNKIGIYVPSTGENGILVPESEHQARIDLITRASADRFGGCSVVPCTGSWLDDSYQLVTEKIAIVYSYTADDILADALPAVVRELSEYCVDWHQFSIALELYTYEFYGDHSTAVPVHRLLGITADTKYSDIGITCGIDSKELDIHLKSFYAYGTAADDTREVAGQ